jgi:methylated-DNA-protein-cysteine methyltransferase-like protein
MKKTQSEHNFFGDVYAVVRLIPKGRATSYGAIAHYLGLKSSARMVGWAMHACPAGLPAHRVVNSLGLLTGKHHFKTPTMMANRLRREGITVVNDKIQGFSEIFWDPASELSVDKPKRRKKSPNNG